MLVSFRTDDLYLPCDVTREKKLILNVLDKIFGDVQKFGLQFNGLQLFDSCGIRHHQVIIMVLLNDLFM